VHVPKASETARGRADQRTSSFAASEAISRPPFLTSAVPVTAGATIVRWETKSFTLTVQE